MTLTLRILGWVFEIRAEPETDEPDDMPRLQANGGGQFDFGFQVEDVQARNVRRRRQTT